MNLAEKSLLVQQLFAELETESKQFATESGLSCISGCGFCCANPKIPASILEFLPLALDLHEKGVAEASLRLLETQENGGNCILYRPQNEDGSKGFCGNYQNRGMICRVFASSARRTKTGQKELIICKPIKESQADRFQEVNLLINEDLHIPMATAYYTQLRDIDESLCDHYPVNEAIRRALELVLRFKFYEEGERAEEV
ncbi:Putative zinc-or iron-chelating domain-containing protein [Algoriphagus ornithinivorans]|uniref:Putative zinc-or iron-chelating domain-containing protein n=1 Tax=Algoriphagus ornithinivorans TaxID=226506 RepID=A0A1I5FTQ6_9BACT|nr:YkgJ family cysteine cluster protein [Algoriphagus ornithinivorans]SFO27140.1 Putative zinc-or iron-chelating domain-containing protein [Algoriphagus ornithinivorans]